jgi:NOL1/NOP2/fmu family ribosome biogenesis protein
LRHGLSDSKGDPDLFAHAMNRALTTATGFFQESNKAENLLKDSMEPFQDWILMDEKYANAYLSGEALANPERKRGLFCVLWKEKWPLGPAKGVESRFNNLLPLESRRRG